MGGYTSSPPLPAELGSDSSLLQYTPILLQELLFDHISAYLLTDASLSSLSRVVPALTISIINIVLPAYTIKATTASSRTTTTRIRLIANAPSLPAL
jgi:hypothetical protein